VRLTSADAGLLVDGGGRAGRLSAQVDDLSLIVPYRTAGDPSTWKLDLKGLGWVSRSRASRSPVRW